MTTSIFEDEASVFLVSIRSFVQMYKDIATLLTCADELMSKKGWIPLVNGKRGNQAVAHASKSIKLPAKWLPLLIYREYVKSIAESGELRTSAFISVTLDYPDLEPDNKPITDPFIAAGYYMHAQDRLKDWPRLYAANLFAGNIDQHGSFIDIQAEWIDENAWKKHHDSFHGGRSKAVVLSAIKTQDDLQSLIVAPLLDELEQIVQPT